MSIQDRQNADQFISLQIEMNAKENDQNVEPSSNPDCYYALLVAVLLPPMMMHLPTYIMNFSLSKKEKG